MEWAELISEAIRYIEQHITEELTVEKVAQAVHLSPYYFQKGFPMLCGYTLGEYIRNRRLTLAGKDLAAGSERVIDIALRYGYDSPDSFTKAFTRFHGVTPAAARREPVLLKCFAAFKIKLSLEGGFLMDYRIEQKEAFTVIGNEKSFRYETARQSIPQFWQEHFAQGKGETVKGEYGINIDENMGHDTFTYLIADPCAPGTKAPQGFTVRTIPALTWAIFPCVGAMPQAFQDVNTKIFSEWLPALKGYEFAAGYCMEYYDDPSKYPKGTQDEKYYSEIWVPIKQKQTL